MIVHSRHHYLTLCTYMYNPEQIVENHPCIFVHGLKWTIARFQPQCTVQYILFSVQFLLLDFYCTQNICFLDKMFKVALLFCLVAAAYALPKEPK